MKIAFVTDQDARNVKNWSGTLTFLSRQLQAQGAELVLINLTDFLHSAVSQSIILNPHKPADSMWHFVSPVTVDFMARQLAFRLKLEPVDLVMSHGVFGVAELDSPTPLVYWEDMPSELLVTTYAKYQGADPDILLRWRELEDKAFAKAVQLFFPSDWSANWTQTQYGVPAEKIAVLPFGANLTEIPDAVELENLIAQRSREVCRLLFVGMDWQRKGGELVMEIAAQLQARGVNTELVLVGGKPEGELPSYVSHTRVDKSSRSSLAKLLTLYRNSHFLLVPSRAEGFGVVFCEAAAHGVPSLSRRVGGIANAVADGQSGHLFAPDAPAADYVATLLRLWQDPDAYTALARSARRYYDETVSWQRFGEKLWPLLERASAAA